MRLEQEPLGELGQPFELTVRQADFGRSQPGSLHSRAWLFSDNEEGSTFSGIFVSGIVRTMAYDIA